MVQVYPVRPDKRRVIPAVTHVDGSGRLQTVSADTNPLYYRLIKEFEAITGVPIVLNTSFNENEPIVETPHQALDCFLRTNMDAIVSGSTVVRRHAAVARCVTAPSAARGSPRSAFAGTGGGLAYVARLLRAYADAVERERRCGPPRWTPPAMARCLAASECRFGRADPHGAGRSAWTGWLSITSGSLASNDGPTAAFGGRTSFSFTMSRPGTGPDPDRVATLRAPRCGWRTPGTRQIACRKGPPRTSGR